MWFIVVSYGAGGSGKSYRIQRMVGAEVRRARGWAFVVLDLNSEWTDPQKNAGLHGQPTIAIARARNANEVRAALAAGARLVVVQPGMDFDDRLVPELANELGQVVTSWRPPPTSTVLVLPEAHVACPEGKPVPQFVARILHRFRHFGCGLWCDTQHPARLSKRVEDEAQQFFFHATSSARDLDRYRDLGGDELVQRVNEACAYFDRKIPGYHVHVSAMRKRGPYRLTR